MHSKKRKPVACVLTAIVIMALVHATLAIVIRTHVDAKKANAKEDSKDASVSKVA